MKTILNKIKDFFSKKDKNLQAIDHLKTAEMQFLSLKSVKIVHFDWRAHYSQSNTHNTNKKEKVSYLKERLNELPVN